MPSRTLWIGWVRERWARWVPVTKPLPKGFARAELDKREVTDDDGEKLLLPAGEQPVGGVRDERG